VAQWLSGALHSQRALEVDITIKWTFVHLHRILASYHALSLRLEALEQRYDEQFRGVIETMKQLTKDDTKCELKVKNEKCRIVENFEDMAHPQKNLFRKTGEIRLKTAAKSNF
jgi:hypothetical protein